MPLPPIHVQLSNFQQIEILRDQIEQFEEELKKTEARIREILYQVEKQRYLQTVHQVFQQGHIVPESETLPELNDARDTLDHALAAMKAALTDLESVSGPLPPRAAPRPQALQSGQSPQHPASVSGVRRNRFDTF